MPQAGRRRVSALLRGVSLALFAVLPTVGWAQQAPMVCCTVTAPVLRVYLDCDRCDTDFVTTNVTFVDYVRDRQEADLHILVTTQATGGGGTEWTIKLIGANRYAGHDRTLAFDTPQTATSDERRKEFVRVLKIGLVDYAAGTTAFPQLDVTWTAPAQAQQTPPGKDPWHYWVFGVSGNGNFNGEESTKSRRLSASASANRTTNDWKINLRASVNDSHSTYTLEDNEKIRSSTSSWSGSLLAVKSLSDHWSLGGTAQVSHSSYSNQNHVIKLAPGIEYDWFPYSESTRRRLTFLYQIGDSAYDYAEETIFGKLHEQIPEHALSVQLSVRQPWGTLSGSTGFTQQINVPKRYRLSTYIEADVRLFKGFSFDVYAEYDRIRNQFYLPKGEASTEDVLLQIRQLATGYSFYSGIGLSYRFGSIFNNIVNPRFGGS
jgi:hypothetical protein